jgi:hypothetical protein
VLREMSVSKLVEVTGDWRKKNMMKNLMICTETTKREIKSGRMRLEGHVASTGERRGKRLFGRRRHKSESIIKINL